MTVTQLRYVIMIAKTGNITQAAKRLFVSQPSLTKSLRELEEEIGETLFARNNRGVSLTRKGEEFLAHARQVVELMDVMEEKYVRSTKRSPLFSVSCQHYSFAVNAFVDVIKKYGYDEYDFTLRETTTHEIVEDVASLKSEVGVLYLSEDNRRVIERLLKESSLEFHSLFVADAHVFISKNHPLAGLDVIRPEQLSDYPYLTFEQGEYNSFFFSEEPVSPDFSSRNIKVRDRATLFNLAVGLDGFTISSGVINRDLNGENIIARRLASDEQMDIGYITRKGVKLSDYAAEYIDRLRHYTAQGGSDTE